MKNLKPYPNYKDSNVEWLGDVPEHWERTRLGTKFIERKEKVSDKDFPPLSVTKNGIVPQLANAAKTNDGDNRKLVKNGDFVINSRSDRKGSSGISKFDGSVSLINIVLKPLNIHPIYCHHLLKSNGFKEEFYRNGHGIVADLWTTRFYDMKSIIVAIPPIEEQTTIANYLDRKTAQIDQAIAQKEDLIQLLKERQQIVIHEAVTQGLDSSVDMKDSGVEWIGKVPKHWEVKKLKYVCNLISEKIFSKESSLNYIGMENIISWTGEYIPSNSETEGLATHFQKGDILFGKLRPYLAKVHLSENEGICSTEFLIYRTRRGSLNYFIHKLMLSYNFIDIVNASTYGSKMPRANSDFIGNLLIALPPKEEQIEIVNYINDQTTKIQKSITQQTALIERLKEYKTVLIDAAVTGKVRVES